MTNEEFRKELIRRAFNLARKTMRLIDKFPKKQSARIIGDQLLRAVTSIGANIIEAQAASSRKDFINFLNHALKSGNEAKFWLALGKDLDNRLVEQLSELIKETDELVRILASSIIKLRNKK